MEGQEDEAAVTDEAAKKSEWATPGHTGLYRVLRTGFDIINPPNSELVLRKCLTEDVSDKDLAAFLRRAMERENVELADEIVSGQKIARHLALALANLEVSHGLRLPTEVWQVIAQMCIQTPRPTRLTDRTPGRLFTKMAPPPLLEEDDCTLPFFLPETPHSPGGDGFRISLSRGTSIGSVCLEEEEDWKNPGGVWLPDIG